jgi:trimeric autotransporter adhesin
LMHNLVPPGVKGNVNVAVADVTGDGRADLILGNKAGTAFAKVSVFSVGTDGIASLVDTTTPFGVKVRSAVRVAALDVNIDGIADILVSGRSGGVYTVKAIDGVTGQEIASFACFDDTRRIPGILAASSGFSNGAIG